MATSGTGHLTLACLARILSQPKPKQQQLEISVCLWQYADAGAESLIEHSYLCASCTFGQAIFNWIVGDDGIRPAALQNKQTGDRSRSRSATVGRCVGAMNRNWAAIL